MKRKRKSDNKNQLKVSKKRKIVITPRSELENLTPNSPFPQNYPLYCVRSIKDFSFVFGHKNWDGVLNVKNDPKLQIDVFGKELKLTNNLYLFKYVNQIGCILNPGDKTFIFGYEKSNDKRSWLIGSLNAVHELIKIGENHLHELIHDIPIKLFLDIEYELTKKSSYLYKVQKKIVLRFIKVFQKNYKKFMEKAFNIKISNKDWLILDSCKQTKISFHVIGNHTNEDKVPIYFKDVYHTRLVILKIMEMVQDKEYAAPVRKIVADMAFHINKPLRMYFCSYKHEKERIFHKFGEKRSPVFNFEDLKKSILQLHPANVKTQFLEINMVEDFQDENKIRQSLNLNRETKIKNLIPRATIKLSNTVDGTASVFVQALIKMLIAVGTLPNGYDFRFLSNHKNKFCVYRCKKSKEVPITVFIDLNGTNSCILQNYKHNHCTGRRIILNSERNQISLWCAADKNNSDHSKKWFAINAKSKLTKRFGVWGLFKRLIKNCNS